MLKRIKATMPGTTEYYMTTRRSPHASQLALIDEMDVQVTLPSNSPEIVAQAQDDQSLSGAFILLELQPPSRSTCHLTTLTSLVKPGTTKIFLAGSSRFRTANRTNVSTAVPKYVQNDDTFVNSFIRTLVTTSVPQYDQNNDASINTFMKI